MSNKINWELVNALSADEKEEKLFWKPYGLPEIISPSESKFSLGVDIQPPWKIPEKIAISTAVTGGMYSSIGNPNHPMTQDEIYQAARGVCLAGAPIVHLHVRNDEGYSVFMGDRFRELLLPLIEEFPNIFFDGCMVAGDAKEMKEICELLKEGTMESTPINVNALIYGDTVFVKPPHVFIEKTRMCQELGVKPQIAVYTDGDVENANRFLIKPGLLEKPYSWALVFGVPGCTPMNNPRAMIDGLMATYQNIMEIDDTSVVMVCAGGRASSYLAALAMMLGIHVRIGMEDTAWKWPHKNAMIENNAADFIRFKAIAEALGREVMTPNEYRKLIGVKEK
jgi:3-keto-5-aminohexanoate cleavage enzyme